MLSPGDKVRVKGFESFGTLRYQNDNRYIIDIDGQELDLTIRDFRELSAYEAMFVMTNNLQKVSEMIMELQKKFGEFADYVKEYKGKNDNSNRRDDESSSTS